MHIVTMSHNAAWPKSVENHNEYVSIFTANMRRLLRTLFASHLTLLKPKAPRRGKQVLGRNLRHAISLTKSLLWKSCGNFESVQAPLKVESLHPQRCETCCSPASSFYGYSFFKLRRTFRLSVISDHCGIK